MTAPANMLIPLNELPTRREVELSNAYVRETIASMPARAILDCPDDDPAAGFARVALDLHNDEDDNVYARGQLSGWLAVACSRCIEPVKITIDETLIVTFMPRDRLPADLAVGTDGLPDSDGDDELG
ncbi:MAG: hypothetical protein AAGC55_20935, partial [Myxococcota bacterium]